MVWQDNLGKALPSTVWYILDRRTHIKVICSIGDGVQRSPKVLHHGFTVDAGTDSLRACNTPG